MFGTRAVNPKTQTSGLSLRNIVQNPKKDTFRFIFDYTLPVQNIVYNKKAQRSNAVYFLTSQIGDPSVFLQAVLTALSHNEHYSIINNTPVRYKLLDPEATETQRRNAMKTLDLLVNTIRDGKPVNVEFELCMSQKSFGVDPTERVGYGWNVYNSDWLHFTYVVPRVPTLKACYNCGLNIL
jgi:hypothetical protein